MSRLAIVLSATSLAACTSTQSARIVAPGKTQLGAGITRATISDEDEVIYAGELRIAHGVNDTTEIAAELARTPGAGETYTNLAIAPKFQLSRNATSAISLTVPVSLTWGERGLDDVGGGTVGLFPTLYAGFDVSKEAELVIAPRIGVAKAVSEDGSLFGIGLSVGLRIGDSATRSAIEPTLGFLRLTPNNENGQGATFLMIGVGVTAGD